MDLARILLPKSNLKYFFVPLFVLALLSSTLINQAHAKIEDLQKITITPSIELKMKPGQASSGKVPLINESSTPLTFNLQVRDITVDNNKGIPKIVASNQLQILSEWVRLSETEVTLKPGERVELTYFIELPKNLLPGGYYASILYQSSSAKDTNSNTQVKTQLGTLIYLTVEGDYLKDAFLKSFNLPSFQEKGPIKPTFEIQNGGTIHIRPKTKLIINSFMRDEVTIEPTEHNIFPGTALLYETEYGTKNMIGLYTVDLEASYGDLEGQKITFQRTILVFPWKIALLILFIVNGIVFLGGAFLHSQRQKNQSVIPNDGIPHPFPTPKS